MSPLHQIQHLLLVNCDTSNADNSTWDDLLVLLNFPHFSPESAQTGSLGATESKVWIGNFNEKARKITEHILHKIKNFSKTSISLESLTIGSENFPLSDTNSTLLVHEIMQHEENKISLCEEDYHRKTTQGILPSPILQHLEHLCCIIYLVKMATHLVCLETL